MPDVNIHRPQLPMAEETDIARYRAVSAGAIVALALGLASPLALFSVVAWALPIGGALVGFFALRRIRAEAPSLLGRNPALVGLALSLVMLAAAPVEHVRHRHEIYREAKQFGALYFRHLRDDQPDRAHQLTLAPQQRRPALEPMSESYPEGSDARQRLLEFVNRSDVRVLLALGKGAEVRYFYTDSVWSEEGKDIIDAVYAVTYRPDGEPTSFFLNVRMTRAPVTELGRSYWTISRVRPGGQPVVLGGSPEQFRRS